MSLIMLKRNSNQSGSILIILLIFLPFLIAMGGIGADIGKLYVTKSELQNAADACALAGAAQFDGQSDQTTRATNAAKVVALKNKIFFQKDTLTEDSVDVAFPTSMNGVSGQYITCTITKSGISNWITPVLNLIGGTIKSSESMNAKATATTRPTQTTCSIPLGICQTNISGKKAGDWLSGVATPNSSGDVGLQSGRFKWVDFTNNGGGADELADSLSGKQSTNCSVKASPDQYIGAPGFKASLRDDFNSRFGIKKKNDSSASYHPDASGYSYYPSPVTSGCNKNGKNCTTTYPLGANDNNKYQSDFAKSGLTNRITTNAIYQGLSGIDLNGSSEVMSSQDLKLYGSTRRVVIAPVIDCSTMKLKSFACVFLLHPMPTESASAFDMYIEYLGDPASNSTPCSKVGGLAGGGSVLGPRVAALVQ